MNKARMQVAGHVAKKQAGDTGLLKVWWAMLDLNQRPHPCEGCALPLSQSPLAKAILAEDSAACHEKTIFLRQLLEA